MATGSGRHTYHHGDLRRAVLREAEALVAAEGPAALTVREVARRAGVAHTSVAHHFGDKTGLTTALAAEGYQLLGDELAEQAARGGGFLELGVAYVRFAVAHPAHFQVMFRPDLRRAGDPVLESARARTRNMLDAGATELAPAGGHRRVAVAWWALVHGLATLWLDGDLPDDLGDDPEEVTRQVAVLLGPPPA
jgi:AcrR family transcriptional regulator